MTVATKSATRSTSALFATPGGARFEEIPVFRGGSSEGLNQDFHFGPGTATVYTRAAPGSISENSSEKKRGRPRVLSERMETRLRGLGGCQQGTRRGRLNGYYFFNGFRLFSGDSGKYDSARIKRWGWLHYDTLGTSRERWRHTIMAEIGRLDHLETMERAADLICELKPSARQAAAMIRRWRRPGQSKPANSYDLAQALCRAFNEYRSVHGDLTLMDARIATIALNLSIRDAYEDSEET